MTPIEYLDAAKQKLDIESDNELAKRIGVVRQRVSAYRGGTQWPNVAACIHLAVILEIDPTTLIADLESQRTKDGKAAAFLRDFVLRAGSAKSRLLARWG